MKTIRAKHFFALTLLAAGAAQAQTPPDQPTTSSPTRVATKAATSALTQAQALGVLSAVNQAEIGAGQLAERKVANGPVRDYAARMVKEHGDNDRKLQAWKPDRGSPLAAAQSTKGKQELAKLGALEEDAFRKAYIEAMIKDHTAALDVIDHQLLPAAQDAQVRAFLQETRAHVAAHLDAAKRLQGDDGAVAVKDGPTG